MSKNYIEMTEEISQYANEIRKSTPDAMRAFEQFSAVYNKETAA